MRDADAKVNRIRFLFDNITTTFDFTGPFQKEEYRQKMTSIIGIGVGVAAAAFLVRPHQIYAIPSRPNLEFKTNTLPRAEQDS